jgi:hypothetical protein
VLRAAIRKQSCLSEPRKETRMGESRGGKEAPDPELAKGIEAVSNALRGLRFGQVTVIIQDGVSTDRAHRANASTACGR